MASWPPTNYENITSPPPWWPPAQKSLWLGEGRVRVGVNNRTYILLTSILSRRGRGAIFYVIPSSKFK
jgi:hypothetical protein